MLHISIKLYQRLFLAAELIKRAYSHTIYTIVNILQYAVFLCKSYIHIRVYTEESDFVPKKASCLPLSWPGFEFSPPLLRMCMFFWSARALSLSMCGVFVGHHWQTQYVYSCIQLFSFWIILNSLALKRCRCDSKKLIFLIHLRFFKIPIKFSKGSACDDKSAWN